MDTYDIDEIEIFAEGTWNNDTYSVSDLDQIVEAFNETKSHLKPYLKLGHSDKQKLLADDELPAAGWVENLKRVGSKLVADFKRIPKKIYEIIKSGGYKRVSIELFINAMVNGKEFPKALKAVALLGGATPAVSTLDDIRALYGSDQGALVYKSGGEIKSYESDIEIIKETEGIDTKSKKMTDQSEVTKMEELEKLRAENAELKKQSEEKDKNYAELSGQVDKFKLEARRSELKNRVSKYIQEKKLAPAQEEILMSILLSAKVMEQKSFKVGDKEYSNLDDLVFALVENNTNGLPTKEQTETGKKFESREDKKETEIDGETLTGLEADKKIKEYAQQNKLSYKEAMFALAGTGAMDRLD